mmetsp:Transcript_3035/g.3408  ORF Transcript_3035/g.3408 Transcript_3035/m.3408 type:complete len:103 (+) Transcript_3035:22-330(+)
MGKFSAFKTLMAGKNWKYCENSLMYKKTFKFKDFKEAWTFLRYLALQSSLEGQDRFGYEYFNVYNTVDIRVPITTPKSLLQIENTKDLLEASGFKYDIRKEK